MSHHPIRAAFLAGTTCLIALAQPASAQENQTYVLDPLVLRAGKPKVASQVPQSVTVVGGQDLEDASPITIGDALANVPGLAGSGSSSFFGQGFNIRGFGANSMAAAEAGIIQLIDGEKKYFESYRQGALFVEPDFLRQVEVLRGPGSSTLYGSGALGGVIAMETIEASDLIAPGQTFGGRAKLGYASNPDTVLGSVAMGWRPSDDFEALAALAWRKLGDTKDGDGNTTIRTNSKTPNLLLKAKKTFGDQYVAFSYQHLEAKGDNQDFDQINGAQVGLFPFFPGWGVGDITTRDQTARLTWGWNPQDNRYIDLAATLSYTNSNKETRQGNDPDEPVMDSLLGEREYELWKLKVVNVADISGAGYDHHLTTGIETWRQDRWSDVPSSSFPQSVTRGNSAFALSELTFGKLTINSGLRYERQRIEPDETVPGTIGDSDRDFEAVEPQVAAIYRLTDRFSVFGSVAFVRRIPSGDELFDGSMAGAANPNLKSEKAKNVEIGASYLGAGLLSGDDELAVKLTLFRNHIDDKIDRSGAGAGAPFVNIDKAYLRGGELEANYAIGAVTLGAALSVVQGVDQDGADLDTLPNNRLALSAAWQATDAWRVGARSTLAAGRDKPGNIRRGGYGVHDLFATWTPQSGAAQGIEVHVGVDNVTDRNYTPASWVSGPAAGRNLKLSVSRSF